MDHQPPIAIFKKDVANAPVSSTKNTSVQGENHIQALTRPIHGRLAVQTETEQNQR